MTTAAPLEIQTWPIDRLVLYARNPRKNDAVVDRMCSSIREFGFKIAVLARSDGEVVDGHLRIKAARKLGISDVPIILCDEWTPAQLKAFWLLVNRSVTWASWDEELLALELQELSEADFDLDLTSFNPGEIDGLLALPDEERANDFTAAGEVTTIIGPDGRPRRGRILSTYRSTGGFLTVWIELEDGLANPANWVAAECTTGVLVLTERDGIYRDLWQGRWRLEAA